MTRPRTFYLVEYPPTFRESRYFRSLERAESRIKHVREYWGIKGKVITVETKETK